MRDNLLLQFAVTVCAVGAWRGSAPGVAVADDPVASPGVVAVRDVDPAVVLARELLANPAITLEEERRLYGLITEGLPTAGREEDAAALLVRNLKYVPRTFTMLVGRGGDNSCGRLCLGAVIRIGRPALAQLAWVLSTSSDAETIRLARVGIHAILHEEMGEDDGSSGRSAAAAAAYLRRAAASEFSDDARRGRMLRAAEFFEGGRARLPCEPFPLLTSKPAGT